MSGIRFALAPCLLALALTGCDKKPEAAKPGARPPTLVTVAAARSEVVESRETSVGTVFSDADPKVAAEVSGRVTRVLVRAGQTVSAGQALAELDRQDLLLKQQTAEAEVRSAQAQVQVQQATIDRNARLIREGFLSPQVQEVAQAEWVARRERLAAVQTQARQVTQDLARTQIRAPYAAEVEAQLIAPGGYARVGDPVFQLVSRHGLKVRLPFPEASTLRIRPGQTVRLGIAGEELGQAVTARISEIRPVVGAQSRAIEVIVPVPAALAHWRPGATVNGTLVLGVREQAVTVPETAVVLRPAGTVVYVAEAGLARQRVVATGVIQSGRVEITQGLKVGETVVVDGAGFLSDGAALKIKGAGSKP